MIRALVTLTTTLLLATTLVASPAQAGHPPRMLGPGDAKVHDVYKTAIVRWSKWGPIYISGKQNNHIKIRYIEKWNVISFRDTGNTHSVRSMPKKRCYKGKVKKGIQVLCKVPKKFKKKRMWVQVWPRLGHDYVNASTLPARFRLSVLADGGRDRIYGGAGADFVNAAFDNDVIYGGPGRDWIRGGPGHDKIVGGPGKDKLRQ